MNKISLLCLALAAGTVASQAVVLKQKPTTRNLKCAKKEMSRRAQADNGIWRPTTEIVSEYDQGEWYETEKYTVKYDDAGRILVDLNEAFEEGTFTRTTYTYDDNGMPASRIVEISEDGENFVYYTRTERKYDPIVTDVIVDNAEYYWLNGEWQQTGNNYRRVITRNAQGNVTQCDVEVLYEGKYDATQRIIVTYGDDNKASSILTQHLGLDDENNYVWENDIEYKDIIWHHTNGQILSEDDITSLYNGVSRCTVLDSDGENVVEVEYPDDLGSYKSHLEYYAGEVNVTFTVLNPYGSYEYVQNDIYREEGAEDFYYIQKKRYVKDSYGLETEIYAAEGETEDSLEVLEWTQADVNYNSNYGYPEVSTVSTLDYETGEFAPMMRIELKDYINLTTSVGSISAADNGVAERFDVNGMRVGPDYRGLVIIRNADGSVSKTIQK